MPDAAGKIRFSNARASRLFGYIREELGETVELLVPERAYGTSIRVRVPVQD